MVVFWVMFAICFGDEVDDEDDGDDDGEDDGDRAPKSLLGAFREDIGFLGGSREAPGVFREASCSLGCCRGPSAEKWRHA